MPGAHHENVAASIVRYAGDSAHVHRDSIVRGRLTRLRLGSAPRLFGILLRSVGLVSELIVLRGESSALHAKSRHLRGERASFASVLSCPSCVGFFADTYGSLLLPGRRRRVECTPERPLCAPLRRSIRCSFL